MLTIYAPASIGNVGVGFDVLGAAISPIDDSLLGDCVSIEAADQFSLQLRGRFVDKLPADPQQNIVWHCWQYFCQEINQHVAVKMTLEKNMPIGSGLGSSACSIVAALVALNDFCEKPLNNQQLLRLMGQLEGKISGSIHYDNVAPCFLGGLQLMLQSCNVISQTVPCFESWFWVMAYPGVKVPTAEARAIMPLTYPKADIVEHGRLLAGFIHASHSGQSKLAASLMRDVVAEPYRTQLLPGFMQARRRVMQQGALACGISGSGPTLFAICDQPDLAQHIKSILIQHYLKNEDGFVHVCRLDTSGARQLG